MTVDELLYGKENMSARLMILEQKMDKLLLQQKRILEKIEMIKEGGDKL